MQRKKTAVSKISRWSVAAITAAVMSACAANPALALDMEFHTYGGFGPVSQAFSKIALIFSDAGFNGLFFTVVAFGILLAGLAWLVRWSENIQKATMSWAISLFIGVLIYLGLFVPKASLTVYDPVLNRFQTIGNLPQAVVALAGATNLVERGLIEIIDTAAVPGAKYTEAAGGIGFQALARSTTIPQKDDNVMASLVRYIDDCVSFELMRPGTTLSLDILRRGTTDFLPELAKAVHPMIWTVHYSAATPQGVSMTCTDAWNAIQPTLASPGYWADAVKTACAAGGFTPSIPTDQQACRDLMTATLLNQAGVSKTPEGFLTQANLAMILADFYYKSEPRMAALMQANQEITSKGVGAGMVMNEWLPIMRAVMTAVAVGLVPFLALLVPTGLWKQALSTMVGFFVFLMTWGVADAVVHGAVMDHAVTAFEEIRQAGLGVYAALALPEQSTKILGMFGMVRSSSMMLASLLTMMLIRFGGHALSMMASSLQGAVQGAGANAGKTMLPGGGVKKSQEEVDHARMLDKYATLDEDRINGVGKGATEDLRQAGLQQDFRQVGSARAEMAGMRQAMKEGNFSGSPVEWNTGRAGAGQSYVGGGGVQTRHIGPGGMQGRQTSKDVDVGGGWQRQSDVGQDGQGMHHDRSGWASAVFSEDNGQQTLSKVDIPGLNVAVGKSAQQQRVRMAAQELSSNNSWALSDSELRQHGLTRADQESFQTSLSQNASKEYSRGLDNLSRYGIDKSSNLAKALQSNASVKATTGSGFELPFGLAKAKIEGQVGGGYELKGTTKDGESVSISLTEKEAEAFKRMESEVRTRAMTETLSDSSNLNYASVVAQNQGYGEAEKYINQARHVEGNEERYGADLTTAFVRAQARQTGGETPENIRRVADGLGQAVASGSLGDAAGRVDDYLRGHSFYGPSARQEVVDTIDATHARLTGRGAEVKGRVEPAADHAAAKTAGIGPQTFAPLDSRGLEPGNVAAAGADLTGRADAIREKHFDDMHGNGRIKNGPVAQAIHNAGNYAKYHLDGSHTDPGILKPGERISGQGGGLGEMIKDIGDKAGGLLDRIGPLPAGAATGMFGPIDPPRPGVAGEQPAPPDMANQAPYVGGPVPSGAALGHPFLSDSPPHDPAGVHQGPAADQAAARTAGDGLPQGAPPQPVKVVKVQPSAADSWRPGDEAASKPAPGGGGKKAVPKDGY